MEPLIGQIEMFGGDFAPRGWAFCDGQLLAISSNTALFSILGTIYGGDGETTFALPDLRGRVSIHAGGYAGPGLTSRRLGEKGGSERTTLNLLNLPAHSHTVQAQNMTFSASSQTATKSSASPTDVLGASTYYSDNAPNTTIQGISVDYSTDMVSGSSQSISTEQPTLVCNYIIALLGIYPSRS